MYCNNCNNCNIAIIAIIATSLYTIHLTFPYPHLPSKIFSHPLCHFANIS